MASNLSVGSSVVVNRPSTGSPDPRQHPFGSRHQAQYPTGYTGRSAEEPTIMSRFPVAFRPPAFASRVILRPPGDSISLTVDLPDQWPGPRRDCHVPHEQDAIGLGAPFHPGTAVLSWPHRPLGQRLPLLNGQSCSPRYHIPPAGLDDDEASSRVHARSPARSSPHLWSSDGTRTSWA